MSINSSSSHPVHLIFTLYGRRVMSRLLEVSQACVKGGHCSRCITTRAEQGSVPFFQTTTTALHTLLISLYRDTGSHAASLRLASSSSFCNLIYVPRPLTHRHLRLQAATTMVFPWSSATLVTSLTCPAEALLKPSTRPDVRFRVTPPPNTNPLLFTCNLASALTTRS